MPLFELFLWFWSNPAPKSNYSPTEISPARPVDEKQPVYNLYTHEMPTGQSASFQHIRYLFQTPVSHKNSAKTLNFYGIRFNHIQPTPIQR